jgi:hypothetical protein
MSAKLVTSDRVDLTDGRNVRILAYEDGSIRVRISDSPYVLEEAFMSGRTGQHTIIKLTPKRD